MTATLSASAAALVALAGGVGVFLGAIGGQVLQAVRDRTDRKIHREQRTFDRQAANEKEIRDRRSASYEQIASALEAIRFRIPALDQSARNLTELDRTSWWDSWVLKRWQEVGGEIDALLIQVRGLAAMYGSDEVQIAVHWLYLHHATPPEREGTGPDGGWEWRILKLNRREAARSSLLHASVQEQFCSEDDQVDVQDWLQSHQVFELTISYILALLRYEAVQASRPLRPKWIEDAIESGLMFFTPYPDEQWPGIQRLPNQGRPAV